MTQPAQAADRQPTVALADPVGQIRQQYESAWQQALKGGAQPSLEAYLAASPEADSDTLRLELERVDQTYRLALGEAGTLNYAPPLPGKDTSPVVPLGTLVYQGR